MSEKIRTGFFALLASLVDYRWIRWGELPMDALGIIFLVLTKFIRPKVYGAAQLAPSWAA